MVGKIVFFLAGLALVGFGAFLWWSDKKKKEACTAKVVGVVKAVDYTVRYKKGRIRNRYRTTFAYSAEGVEYVKQSNILTRIPKFSEGQSVTAFYDPADPQQFYVLEEADSMVILFLSLIALGVAFILIGTFSSPGSINTRFKP